MRKVVLTYGLIAGAIVFIMILGSVPLWNRGLLNFNNGEIVGYTTIVIALSMVFFGIRSCRDFHFGGSITFWQGVKIGLLITAIASVMYVLAWEISFNFLTPGFKDKMWEHFIENARNEAKNETELNAAIEQIETWKGWYKNPFLRFALTLMEIAPIGIVITVISALVLKKAGERD